ncbi:MAG: AmmeMemoRadiSam system protein B, partial [Spirochaetota bacterium]|nr:AmmeMemoRadiSam system protein B [Spirochaetota bacterium]
HFINLLQSMEGELAIKHSLENSSACSSGGAASCLTASKVFGNKTCGEIIDYYTSYDISKNSSFVGYLGMVF